MLDEKEIERKLFKSKYSVLLIDDGDGGEILSWKHRKYWITYHAAVFGSSLKRFFLVNPKRYRVVSIIRN